MLNWLFERLSEYYSVFSVFQYITFRAMMSVLTALVLSFVFGPVMIRKLSQYQIGQTVRDDGPASHFSKMGTPTMGDGSVKSICLGNLIRDHHLWLYWLV